MPHTAVLTVDTSLFIANMNASTSTIRFTWEWSSLMCLLVGFLISPKTNHQGSAPNPVDDIPKLHQSWSSHSYKLYPIFHQFEPNKSYKEYLTKYYSKINAFFGRKQSRSLNINNITYLGCIYTTEIINLTNKLTCKQKKKLTPNSEELLWVK